MKIISIPEVGDVQISKHARSRSIRITLSGDGKVKITIPTWVPYQAGVAFAHSKKAWILEHSQKSNLLQSGMTIGKGHTLLFNVSFSQSSVTARQKGNVILVKFPSKYKPEDAPVQAAAKKASLKALRDQAEDLLPGRLRDLAQQHGFVFKSVSVRQLKARWGSCNSHKEITLNFFLMQLPWDLIDYVLLHELTHTKALHHGEDFWHIFNQALPGAKQKRKELRNYSPNF